MKILVIGGTRFFGIHMVNEFLAKGHDVTIATRGKASDEYGDRVRRVIIERTNEDSMKNVFHAMFYNGEFLTNEQFNDKKFLKMVQSK